MASEFDQFSPVSKSDWLEQVVRDLKGRSLEELDHDWTKSIRLSPFFHPEDQPERPEPLPQSAAGGWLIGESFDLNDPQSVNSLLRKALELGVNAPHLRLVRPLSTADWDSVLSGVEPQMIFLDIYPEFQASEPATWLDPFLAALRKKEVPTDSLQGSIRIGEEAMPEALANWGVLHQQLPRMRKLYIDAVESYRSDEPETELALATYMAYYRLREAIDRGIDPQEAHANLTITLAVGTSFFRNLAKLRAFRLVWANVLQAAGLQMEAPPFLSVFFAPDSQDEATYTNMIRATTQSMSAVLGGADHLTIRPADAPVTGGEYSTFTRRVARNVNHILSMEAKLGQVGDPAAGSYFVEALTRRMAEKAFALFREMQAP